MGLVRGAIAASVFLWLFIALIVLWVLGWLVFHIAIGLLKLLPVVALIVLVVYLVRRSGSGR